MASSAFGLQITCETNNQIMLYLELIGLSDPTNRTSTTDYVIYKYISRSSFKAEHLLHKPTYCVSFTLPLLAYRVYSMFILKRENHVFHLQPQHY